MEKNNIKQKSSQTISQKQIETILIGKDIEKLAIEYGVADQRKNKLTVSCFVYVMLLGSSLGLKLTFEELSIKAEEWHLTRNRDGIEGNRINQQLGERGEAFAKGLFQYLLQQVLCFNRRGARRLSKYFQKILCQDGSVIRLCQQLVDLYTGTHDEAALKIQVRYEVLSGAAELVGVANGKRGDNSYQTPKKYGKDVLWLVDLGYYDFDRFKSIAAAGQYFVSRVKTNVVAYIIDQCPLEWQGLPLNALPIVSGETYDMIAGLGDDLVVRLVGTYNEEEDNHWWYMTNIEDSTFSAHDIQGLYRLRWEIELFFRSLKHVLNAVKILNKKDKSKIRSQLYYVFCYYLLIQLIRLKAAHIKRIKWQHLSFVMCERIFRLWFLKYQEEKWYSEETKLDFKLLMDQIRKVAYR